MSTGERHSYVEMYPSDWLAGMGFMPPLVEWVYLQICLYNWDKAEPVPAAEIRLRLARHAEWETDLKLLIDAGKVHKTQGGGFFVSRALAQARKAYELWEKKSQGGKNSRKQGLDNESRKTPPSTAPQNENENENDKDDKSSSRARARPREAVGDLVFSVPAEAWSDFRKHRDKLKAPMTQRAETLMLKKLEALNAKGHDPTAVLEQSMVKGWRDVFEIKGQRDERSSGNGNRPNRTGDGFVDAGLEAIFEREQRERSNR